MEDHVDELNDIARWYAEHRDGEMIAVDPLKGLRTSILDGLKTQKGAHFKAPPTVNGRVRFYREAPKLHFPILFLHVATTERSEIEPFISKVKTGTVVYGTAEACAIVLEAAQSEAQPLYFHHDRIAVRIA